MAKRKRDTTQKRQSILDAAVRAFRDLGYDNASMDHISELANSSKRTVYNHFPSKEALFSAVLNRFIDETCDLKQISYSPTRSLVSQLADFAQAKIAIATNPAWLGLMKVTIGVFVSHPEFAHQAMQRTEDKEDTLATWLQAAQADQRLHVPDPKLAANAFWAMISGAFFWPAILEGPQKPDQANVLKTELIQIFLARYTK